MWQQLKPQLPIMRQDQKPMSPGLDPSVDRITSYYKDRKEPSGIKPITEFNLKFWKDTHEMVNSDYLKLGNEWEQSKGVSLFHPGCSAVVRSLLAATFTSQVQAILLPQPPE
ncbi:putative phosphatidylinositol 3,4,5-trisphosphate 3-phosphatase TPTE2P1 [Plecturocebus cupreus]